MAEKRFCFWVFVDSALAFRSELLTGNIYRVEQLIPLYILTHNTDTTIAEIKLQLFSTPVLPESLIPDDSDVDRLATFTALITFPDSFNKVHRSKFPAHFFCLALAFLFGAS